MGLWDKVKANGQKVKLQGEITLLRREIIGREKIFGIEFYDLLTNDKNTLLGVSAGTLFKNNDGEHRHFKEPLERAREDIVSIQAKKDRKQQELDVLEVKGAHTLPDTTLGQKANKAGRAIANGAKATKIQTELALLDREIKIRKEQFGIEVFTNFAQDEQQEQEQQQADGTSSGKKGSGGTFVNPIKTLSKAVANLSQQEKDIQACIVKAKEDVMKLRGNIRSKEREIHSLNDGETEPMVNRV